MAAKKKATKKKATAKKKPVAKKKTTAKKKASAAKAKKPPTKSEILTSIADTTDLSRKEVQSVLTALEELIQKNLRTKVGMFSVPGLMKIKVVKKPATKERKGPNPFNKDEIITFKAKPARKVVKVLALKGLKDMVA